MIADLLIAIQRKVLKFNAQPACSTIAGLVRMHLMRLAWPGLDPGWTCTS